eukprot:TRINITY_DN139765_c0_g1_i1.p1 TRINITY_DN139765_c0_g1~~TRINITY_DN139765_c0_g1_i1.p1  ORF type:complete len:313 (+),score=33.17 TRINITY_DN139765_c0_g1_i1:309-1247(+)
MTCQITCGLQASQRKIPSELPTKFSLHNNQPIAILQPLSSLGKYQDITDRELYEKSLLVKSIVEGIVESKGATDNKRKTIADKIIEFMQENPGRPSYEMTIGKRTDKGKSVNKRYDNKSAWVSESKEGSAEMVKIVEEESQDGKLIASANKEEAKIGPDRRQQEYDEITEDTKENTRVEDSAYKMHKEDNEEVTNPEAQYEDYRVSDVLEESKDKRIARTECVKGRGLHINPFRQVAKKVQNLPERQKIRREIIKQAPRGGINIENSITDVSCNYFVTSKLNKMCDYIAQNTDCSIFQPCTYFNYINFACLL